MLEALAEAARLSSVRCEMNNSCRTRRVFEFARTEIPQEFRVRTFGVKLSWSLIALIFADPISHRSEHSIWLLPRGYISKFA
jgi:hypothetical protein